MGASLPRQSAESLMRWVISKQETLHFLAADGEWPICRRRVCIPIAYPIGSGEGVGAAAAMRMKTCDKCFAQLPAAVQREVAAALELATS